MGAEATRAGSEAGFRTLADQLRAWPDARLGRLLSDRPDLATPAPHDSSQLASRAANRASLARALDSLTRGELLVLDALVVAGQTPREGIARLVRVEGDPAWLEATLDRLEGLAVCWTAPEGLRALSEVADALSRGPADTVSGLRPFSPAAPSPAEAEVGIGRLTPPARGLLEHVVAQGGEGHTGTARLTVAVADAATPVEELIAHRLLVPSGPGTVVVPGQVGVALRGGRTTLTPVDACPALATGERSAELSTKAAAGAAFELARRVELLLDTWGDTPPGALRTGGLGVRDLKAAARLLHLGEPETALVIEVCFAAGLLAVGETPAGDEAWLPTEAYDAWMAQPVAERWTDLAEAWLGSARMPSLVGSRDVGGRAATALDPELSSAFQAETRRLALAQLAELGPGVVLAAGTGLPSLIARVTWLRPRRPATRAEQIAASVTEAEHLGVAGLGALPEHTRLLLAGDPAGCAAALAPLLPQPVDHVLVQADLTAVAPGPLRSDLNRTLHLLADVESRGGATVYRFTPPSVRRAFDAGWTAAEVRDWLADVSRTPVPQPLDYLVDDVARSFGVLRAGHAEAFLRSDDETALTELLHHPKAATLRLRRIAPTGVVTDTPLDVLLPRLRELGAAPVVEALDGTVRVARPDVLRARETRRTAAGQRSARTTAQLTAVVRAIRSGDEAREAGAARPREVTSPSHALAALREAVETETAVLIGYVDNHGATSERLVEPRRVEGGRLTAYDRRRDEERTFAVHRITVVQAVPDERV